MGDVPRMTPCRVSLAAVPSAVTMRSTASGRRGGVAVTIDRVGIAAGISAVGIALVAAIAVPLGFWTPWLAWPGALAITAAGWVMAGWSAGLEVSTATDDGRRTLLLSSLTTAGLALAFTVWNAVLHAEHLVLRRDPGAYGLYTQWIATRHRLPIPADLAAFGGPAAYDVTGFTLDAPAYYQVLHGTGAGLQAEIVPQFLVGPPALYSFGWWAGSAVGQPWAGAQIMPALLGGLALVTFGSLATRLIGPRWTPLAVAVLAVSYPVAWSARTTFSEPAALLVLLAGACLAVDAIGSGRRALGGLAGAVLGLAGLIRVDSVREVAAVVAVCVLPAVRGNRAAAPLAGGAVAGTLVSIGVWSIMSRPYLNTVSSSLVPLLAATGALVLVAAVVVPLARRRDRARSTDGMAAAAQPARAHRLMARGASVGVVAVGLVLLSRPLWLIARQAPDTPSARFVASLQAGQGLAVDAGRLYSEHSLAWVAWYLGWGGVVIAWGVLAALAGQVVTWWFARRATPPTWLLPAVAGFGSTVLVLYRPGITPDHPWADRRLVTVVLPVIVLAAVAGIAWSTRVLGARTSALGRRVLAAAGVAVLLGPTVWATAPVALLRTERGEVAAVGSVCAQLQPGDVVVAVEGTDDGHAQRSANEWLQVIRGVCGHPSGALLTPVAQLPDAVTRLAALVEGAGGHLVLLTAQEDAAAAQRVLDAATAGTSREGAPRLPAARLSTVEDRKLLTRRPPNGARLVIEVWLAR